MPTTRYSIVPPTLSNDVLAKENSGSSGVHFSLRRSHESLQSQSSDEFISKLEQHQIIKQITDWFEAWKPWQQKTLLCGITNRCTTQQLEAFATTLEPIFHRDFIASVRQKYPSSGLQKRPTLGQKTLTSFSNFAPSPSLNEPQVSLTSRYLTDAVLRYASQAQHHNAWTSHQAPYVSPGSLPPSRRESSVARSLDSAGFIRNHQHRSVSRRSSQRLSFIEFMQKQSQPIKRSKSQAKFKQFKGHSKSKSKANSRLKQRRSSLASQFRDQLSHIWQWISGWEDHDAMHLMSIIVKMCTPDIQNYLAQCLYQRLRERIDINWLPDNVLLTIFSFLCYEDVLSVEKVCMRWKHLCSSEDLWQFKCQEFGEINNIHDLSSVIRRSLPDQETIDWRLAFSELRHLVSEFHRDVPLPSELSIRSVRDSFSPTRSRMVSDNLLLSKDLYGSTMSLKSKSVQGPPRMASQLAQESRRLKQGLPLSKFMRLQLASSLDNYASSVSEHDMKSEEESKNRRISPREMESVRSCPPVVESPLKSEISGTIVSSGPLLIRGQKKKKDEDGEKAWDIRMILNQSHDLLGKCPSELSMKWKTESVDGDTPLGVRSEDYSSSVKPIARVRKLQGHMDGVTCVEIDFRRLISGSVDRSVRIWDIRSGRSIHKLYGHKGKICCLKFEDNILYTASWDATIMVWELVDFSRIKVLTGHDGSVSCLHLTKDFLVSGSHDMTVRLWCRRTLTCARVIEGHRSPVLCLHCDTSYIYSGSSDKTVRQTALRSGECVRVFSSFNHPLHRIYVRNQLLVAASTCGLLSFCNIETNEVEAMIQAHKGAINAIGLCQGHLYTAGGDCVVKEWDLLSMTCIRSLVGHKKPVLDMKVNQRRIVSSSADGHIRIWETYIPESQKDNPGNDLLPLKIINQEEMGLL